VTVELLYLALRGKSYYPLDVVPVLFAAGAVSVATWKRWRVVAIGLIVVALVALPVTLPILPRATMIRLDLDKARDDFSAELGWPTVATKIADAYARVPARERRHTIILTQNYSQAAAVNRFGRRHGLPEALSGHNTYWMWLPANASIDSVVTVGFTESELREWFGRIVAVGRVPDTRLVDVEERDVRMYWCSRPLVSTGQLWTDVKLFS
jgi:hypothetical protein